MEQEDISSYLQNVRRLEIPEQDLTLILDSYSIFQGHNGIHLIVANENYFARGMNMGRLMAGLVKFKLLVLENRVYIERKLVIPFSSKLLVANWLDDNHIQLIYMENGKREFKTVEIHNDEVFYQDYKFLLEEENFDISALNNTYLLELPIPFRRELKQKNDCIS